MDKLGAKKKDKITQNIVGFQEHKIKSFAWRAYGRHAISTVIIIIIKKNKKNIYIYNNNNPMISAYNLRPIIIRWVFLHIKLLSKKKESV